MYSLITPKHDRKSTSTDNKSVLEVVTRGEWVYSNVVVKAKWLILAVRQTGFTVISPYRPKGYTKVIYVVH